MAIQTIKDGDRCELMVSGRVDGEGANQLEMDILAAVRGGAKQISVNMAGANFLCSAGIRVLLQHWRQLKQNGKVLAIASPSPEIDSVLQITGFRDLIVERPRPAGP